ncbi:MAG: zf-HC2 domain-containing protein [Verrucomicrobia bacterium]|nr:zf-HC2 domain-containing protein [Verrucomicrobiota bacterium]
MNCQQSRERLHDYLDEALEAAERAQVSEHLTGCAACRREIEELRKVAALVGSLDELPVPGGFLHSVRARIDRPTVWERLRGLLVTPRPGVSVAVPVIIVAFVAAFYVMTRPPKVAEQSRPESQPKAGEIEVAYDYDAEGRPGRDGNGSFGATFDALEKTKADKSNGLLRGRNLEYADGSDESVLSETEEGESQPMIGREAKGDDLVLADVGSRSGDTQPSARAKDARGAGPTEAGSSVRTGSDESDEVPSDAEKETTRDEDRWFGSQVRGEVGKPEDHARVMFTVLDLDTDVARVLRIARAHGGTVTEQWTDAELSALIIDMPVKQFDKALEEIDLENAKNVEALNKQRAVAEQHQSARRMLLLIVRRIEEVAPGE